MDEIILAPTELAKLFLTDVVDANAGLDYSAPDSAGRFYRLVQHVGELTEVMLNASGQNGPAFLPRTYDGIWRAAVAIAADALRIGLEGDRLFIVPTTACGLTPREKPEDEPEPAEPEPAPVAADEPPAGTLRLSRDPGSDTLWNVDVLDAEEGWQSRAGRVHENYARGVLARARKHDPEKPKPAEGALRLTIIDVDRIGLNSYEVDRWDGREWKTIAAASTLETALAFMARHAAGDVEHVATAAHAIGMFRVRRQETPTGEYFVLECRGVAQWHTTMSSPEFETVVGVLRALRRDRAAPKEIGDTSLVQILDGFDIDIWNGSRWIECENGLSLDDAMRRMDEIATGGTRVPLGTAEQVSSTPVDFDTLDRAERYAEDLLEKVWRAPFVEPATRELAHRLLVSVILNMFDAQVTPGEVVGYLSGVPRPKPASFTLGGQPTGTPTAEHVEDLINRIADTLPDYSRETMEFKRDTVAQIIKRLVNAGMTDTTIKAMLLDRQPAKRAEIHGTFNAQGWRPDMTRAGPALIEALNGIDSLFNFSQSSREWFVNTWAGLPAYDEVIRHYDAWSAAQLGTSGGLHGTFSSTGWIPDMSKAGEQLRTVCSRIGLSHFKFAAEPGYSDPREFFLEQWHATPEARDEIVRHYDAWSAARTAEPDAMVTRQDADENYKALIDGHTDIFSTIAVVRSGLDKVVAPGTEASRYINGALNRIVNISSSALGKVWPTDGVRTPTNAEVDAMVTRSDREAELTECLETLREVIDVEGSSQTGLTWRMRAIMIKDIDEALGREVTPELAAACEPDPVVAPAHIPGAVTANTVTIFPAAGQWRVVKDGKLVAVDCTEEAAHVLLGGLPQPAVAPALPAIPIGDRRMVTLRSWGSDTVAHAVETWTGEKFKAIAIFADVDDAQKCLNGETPPFMKAAPRRDAEQLARIVRDLVEYVETSSSLMEARAATHARVARSHAVELLKRYARA
jgi:hypothetical protein